MQPFPRSVEPYCFERSQSATQPPWNYKLEGIEYTESDIRITITEPYVGTLNAPVKQENLPWGIEKIKADKAGNGVKAEESGLL